MIVKLYTFLPSPKCYKVLVIINIKSPRAFGEHLLSAMGMSAVLENNGLNDKARGWCRPRGLSLK